MKFTLEELIRITNAKAIINKNTQKKYEISTDTRTIQENNVYLPLKGDNFDGEAFINNALEKGASGFFCTTNKFAAQNANFILIVEDTKTAYLKLANFYKQKINPTTIAITGSSGKTTTKEILNAIFKKNRKTHKSQLNYNNEIGLCQTLLSMPEDTEVLIIEMGMRGLGEIDLLSKYAKPDIALITNIGTAHIGRLGNRENIAKAKCEIVNYMGNNGVLITHNDIIYNQALIKYSGRRIQISANDYKIDHMSNNLCEFQYKNYTYRLCSGGEHILLDALLGIEAALFYGLTPAEIQSGLSEYKSIEKRFEEITVSGLKIINDSYNANPDSMKAAIKTYLDLYTGDKVLVLGDMGELGEKELQYHKDIGNFLNKFNNVTEVITVGKLAKNISENTVHKSTAFCNNTEAANYIKCLKKGTTILLKGSRSMKLEEIIKELEK